MYDFFVKYNKKENTCFNISTMNIDMLVKRIESLNKENQIRVLKWFVDKDTLISENNNGVFINLNGMTYNQLLVLDIFVQSLEKTEPKKQNLLNWLNNNG